MYKHTNNKPVKFYKSMEHLDAFLGQTQKCKGFIIADIVNKSICDDEILVDFKAMKLRVDEVNKDFIKVGEIFLQNKTEMNEADYDLISDFFEDDFPIVTSSEYQIKVMLYSMGIFRYIYSIYDLAGDISFFEEQDVDEIKKINSLSMGKDVDFNVTQIKNLLPYYISLFLKYYTKQKEQNDGKETVSVIDVAADDDSADGMGIKVTTDKGTYIYDSWYHCWLSYCDTDIDMKQLRAEALKFFDVQSDTEMAIKARDKIADSMFVQE